MKPTSFLRLLLVIVTLYALQSTQLCLPAIADDPILSNGGGGGGLVFGGGARTDEGAEGLGNTGGGGGLVFGGGARSEGMAPDDGADGLGNSGGPVVDLDTNDGPAEPNESAESPPCAAASSMFAPALAAMGENPCP
jgi:hypothetical protein